VLALTDERNQPPRSNLAPLLVGLAVAAIGMSFGANAGYAINPARDFGPRVFAWLAGWGRVALPGVHGYVWVPIIGPLVGGVVGAVVYDLPCGAVDSMAQMAWGGGWQPPRTCPPVRRWRHGAAGPGLPHVEPAGSPLRPPGHLTAQLQLPQGEDHGDHPEDPGVPGLVLDPGVAEHPRRDEHQTPSTGCA
jgi:hypothetical protein